MTDRELMQMAIDALEQPSPIGGFDNQAYVAKALRNRLAQPKRVHAIDISQERVDETAKRKHEPVEYTGNGTAGREKMTAPSGYFFQMPKEKNT